MKTDKEIFLDELVRVNLAGEYGAKRIYEGQLAALKNSPDAYKKVEHMLAQELEHLKYFEKELVIRKSRPSLFSPLWHVGGFALGYITAKLGEKSAYACTIAVEEVIDKHYQEQILEIEKFSSEENDETLNILKNDIEKFRCEEVEHKETSEAEGASTSRLYPLIHFAVSNISKIAIKVAKKI
ncbi:MAG: demethoxyubiquinone hydroxylase family protein [Rickettsiales bacterium]|nr:demethoxyubiquinone hydroxylase family protein [Rickettsiales bacterium]